MWHNTEHPRPDDADDSAGFADQVHPSLVVIVCALLLAGFWSLVYLSGRSIGLWS